MKKLSTFMTLSILGLMVPQANAQRRCSNTDVVGVYSFVASGTFGTAGFATAGQTIYDGNGGASGIINISLGGTVTGPIAWTGTYSVNADCTFTKTIIIPGLGPMGAPLKANFFLTASDNFAELRFIATDAGTVITGTARRQQH